MLAILKLEPQIWFAEMIELLDDCAQATKAQEQSLVQRAHSLQHSAPVEWLSQHAIESDVRMHEMLAAKCYVEAAFSLAGQSCSFMVSRSTSGRCICTAVLRGQSEEAHFEADSLAIAILGGFLGGQILMFQSRDQEEQYNGPRIAG